MRANSVKALSSEKRVIRFPTTPFVTPPARDAAGNAEVLHDYAQRGLSHVMIWLDPSTPDGVAAFGETIALLDA